MTEQDNTGRPGGLSSATEPQASRPSRASIPDALRPTFEQCAVVVASYIVDNDWAGATSCAKANQRANGFDEYKLLARAKEVASRDGDRFTDMSGAYQVVAEMLDYFDSYRLATWAPLASIIKRERRDAAAQAIEARRAATTGAVEDESAVSEGNAPGEAKEPQP